MCSKLFDLSIVVLSLGAALSVTACSERVHQFELMRVEVESASAQRAADEASNSASQIANIRERLERVTGELHKSSRSAEQTMNEVSKLGGAAKVTNLTVSKQSKVVPHE